MRTSEVLRRAAKRIDDNLSTCCCWAISGARHVLGGSNDNAEGILCFYFKPQTNGPFWWPDFSDKSQSERVLALLFAAAIAESEGD